MRRDRQLRLPVLCDVEGLEAGDAAELLEWVGEDFDPEAFDLDATNLVLTRTVRRAATRTD